MNKKLKVKLILLAPFVILLSLLIFEFFTSKKNHDDSRIAELQKIYNGKIAASQNSFNLFFNNILSSKENREIIQESYLNPERRTYLRDKLYKNIEPYYKNLVGIGFSNIVYLYPDGTVFLRMSKPDKHSENLAEKVPLVEKAIKTSSRLSAFSVAPYVSGVSFSAPIMENNQQLGFVIGTVATWQLTSMLRKEFDGNFCFMLDKETIDTTLQQESMQNYTTSTIDQNYYEPNGYATSISCLKTKEMIAKKGRILLNGKAKVVHAYQNILTSHSSTFVPVFLINGKPVGYIVQYGQETFYAELINSLLLKISSLTILFFILYRAFTKEQELFEKIEKNEREYRSIFENASIGFCHVALDGKYIRVNKTLCDMLGYIADEMKQLDTNATSHKDEIQNDMKYVSMMLRREINNCSFEKRFVTKDGKIVWGHLSVGVSLDENDNVEFFIGSIQNITDKKIAQDLIVHKNKQMQTVLDQMPSIVCIKNKEHQWLFVNQALANLLESTKEELVGKNDSLFFSAETVKNTWAHDDEVLDEWTAMTVEETKVDINGNNRYFISSRLPYIIDDEGIGVLTVSTDVTAQFEARRSSELLRKFFDSTKEAMLITDEHAQIQRANRAFTDITGYTLEEVQGKNPRILQSGKHDNAFYEQMWLEIIRDGRWAGEIYNKRKSGEVCPGWLVITAIRGGHGEITNFISTFLDLSSVRHSEETIKKQAEMLVFQSRYAVMGEMISMIAHQWRQPITAMGMSANNMLIDIALGEIDSGKFQNHLESINTQIQFLSRTIDDFRNFFKPKTDLEDISSFELIDTSLKIIGKSLENNGITIEKIMMCDECSRDSCFAKLRVNSGEIVQAIIVFLQNAKDALLEKGVKNPTINIYCKTDSDKKMLELGVGDNAGGIPEEIKYKIFEPYFTTKSTKNGTGLGLYIAKTIVEKYSNGEIGVYNTAEGANFYIRLPIVGEE